MAPRRILPGSSLYPLVRKAMDFSTREGVCTRPSRSGSSPRRPRISRYISSVLTPLSPASLSTALGIDLLTAIGCAIASILSPEGSGRRSSRFKITHRRTERNCSRFLPREHIPNQRSGARFSILDRPPYKDSPSSALDSQTADQSSNSCGQTVEEQMFAPLHLKLPC